MMIKPAITAACLATGSTSSSAYAQDVGAYLDQCLEAVTTRDVTVFGDQPTIVAVGEAGDATIRRIFKTDADTTGISEMEFAVGLLNYDLFPRTGADCSVTMVLNDAATQATADFRKGFTKQFGPVSERKNEEFSAEVDEVACLPTGFPLRLMVHVNEADIRLSIWDSIPERPAC